MKIPLNSDRRPYVQAVIDTYIALPHTPDHARRSDRDLAAQFYDCDIPFSVVRVALLLATARRLIRHSPLPPIRSLHYFLPVIEEVQHNLPSPSYVQYLELKIRHLLERE
jgi:hypothetical protein